jgi:hypothetical protein
MTQAMNLANFANSLDSSGGLPPTQLSSPVPISKGGTNAATASDARANLGLEIGTDIPALDGTGATGTWSINVTGSSTAIESANFTIEESGGSLLIKYGATIIVTISSTGEIVASGSVSGS